MAGLYKKKKKGVIGMDGTLVMRELTLFSVLLRCLAAVFLGGIIGLERGLKNRAAGFRTYMLVCLGACMVMLTNQYAFQVYGVGDLLRMGAQVVSGIGFLGAGTIVVTSHSRIKGLTTAAGLWSAACVGLALGIGFYEVAFIGTLAIVLVLTLLHLWDLHMRRHTRSAEVYVELEPKITIGEFLKNARSEGVLFSNFTMQFELNVGESGLAFLATVTAKKRCNREDSVDSVRGLAGVRFCEEL